MCRSNSAFRQGRVFAWKSRWYTSGMNKAIRQKRSDTLVRTIERKYGVDLGYRSDAELHTVLKKEGLPSLSKLLKMTQKGSR